MQCFRKKDEPNPLDPSVARKHFARTIDPDAVAPATQFFERYENGEHESVWNDMRALGAEIGKGPVWEDVRRTVRLSMARARFNIETIIDRLHCLGYLFSDPEAAYQQPTAEMLEHLHILETEVGVLPLSLRLFYETVGSLNLCQSIAQLDQGNFDEESRKKVPPLQLLGEEYPLYVADPKTLLHELRHAQSISDGRRHVWIAPDECGRAHYSNGDDCHLLLPEPGVDFRWIEMRDDNPPGDEWLWFVDVLRQAFRGGGFQGRSDPTYGYERRPPDHDLARKLSDGLLSI